MPSEPSELKPISYGRSRGPKTISDRCPLIGSAVATSSSARHLWPLSARFRAGRSWMAIGSFRWIAAYRGQSKLTLAHALQEALKRKDLFRKTGRGRCTSK